MLIMWNNTRTVKSYEEWLKEINKYEAILQKCLNLITRFLSRKSIGDMLYIVILANIGEIEVVVKEVVDNFPKELIEREYHFREKANSIVKDLKRIQQNLNDITEFLEQNSECECFMNYLGTNVDIDNVFNYYFQCLVKQSKFIGERIEAINYGLQNAKNHSVSTIISESSDFNHSNNARWFSSKKILIGLLIVFCFLILLPVVIWHYIIKDRKNIRLKN